MTRGARHKLALTLPVVLSTVAAMCSPSGAEDNGTRTGTGQQAPPAASPPTPSETAERAQPAEPPRPEVTPAPRAPAPRPAPQPEEPPQDTPPKAPETPPKAPEPPPQEPPAPPPEPAPPPAPPVPPVPEPATEEPSKAPAAPSDGEEPAAPDAASPPAEKPPHPDADVPTDEEDAAARAVLASAADRQGGKSLAPPDGSLDSFRVVFHKVTLHRVREEPDGRLTRQRMDSETPGLIVHWKAGQIRTEWHLTGEKPLVRGVLARAKPDGTTADFPWLFDGAKATPLLGDDYAKDRAEIERDRRIVRALLQAAVLRSMLTDGSRWKLVDDPTFEGRALRRSPPAGSDQPLRLTLWIDAKSSDVTAAKLSPNEPGESTMTYALEYHPEFPKVKDAVLRFPFHFRVREQRVVEQEPMDVMEGWASEASFNDVEDAEFRPPKAR